MMGQKKVAVGHKGTWENKRHMGKGDKYTLLWVRGDVGTVGWREGSMRKTIEHWKLVHSKTQGSQKVQRKC